MNDRDLARAMRELRRVFPNLVVLRDYTRPAASPDVLPPIIPTVIDQRAIASGKRRASARAYRDAQAATGKRPA